MLFKDINCKIHFVYNVDIEFTIAWKDHRVGCIKRMSGNTVQGSRCKYTVYIFSISRNYNFLSWKLQYMKMYNLYSYIIRCMTLLLVQSFIEL